MNSDTKIIAPRELPFLKAICWDLRDIDVLDQVEILNRYERGWNYRGALEDLGTEELAFVAKLAQLHGSWLQVDV